MNLLIIKQYIFLLIIFSLFISEICSCDFKAVDKKKAGTVLTSAPPVNNLCAKTSTVRIDTAAPQSLVSDWGTPKRLTLNTLCPEDAIEISPDGNTLYFMFARDITQNQTAEELIKRPNGTYNVTKSPSSGPLGFANMAYVDLGSGADSSLDGELSFYGTTVFFHSLRSANTGIAGSQQCCIGSPETCFYDILDIYTGTLQSNGTITGITNIGLPNSSCLDGEHAIYPDGEMLFFASNRKRHTGDTRTDNDIWVSIKSSGVWGAPFYSGGGLENINSAGNDQQPTFTSDGLTIYFASDREGEMKIYRSTYSGGMWQVPVKVIGGVVGEPAITADGKFLYFVHVLADSNGVFDADIWYVEKK